MTHYSVSLDSSEESSVHPHISFHNDFSKISAIPVDEQIKLNEDTTYRFSCEVRDNCLYLKLEEIGAYAPYFYERILTLDKMRQINRIFMACDDLETVKRELEQMFKKKQIKLIKESDKTITFVIKAFMLSSIETFKIEFNMKITTEKKESLMKLYYIEKRQIKCWKEFEKYAKSFGAKGKQIQSKMKEIEQKYK